MSLFGGDSAQHSASSFSFSPISSRASSPASPPRQSAAQEEVNEEELDPVSALSNEAERLDTEETEDERQRFTGSDQLWRYYVRDEIALARSLDDIRGDDLAAHLYNAHAWKRRSYDVARTGTQPLLEDKSSWLGADADEKSVWHPRRKWTGWPLEPENLSGPQETFWNQSGGVDTPSPTNLLRIELEGLALRVAKRQWLQRAEHDIAAAPLSQSRTRTGSASSASSASGKSEPDEDEEGEEAEVVEVVVPVVSADDARSSKILRPSINSVLSQLDRLLMALHHNRAGQHAATRSEDAVHLRRSSLSRSRSVSQIRYRRRNSTDIDADQSVVEQDDQNSRPNKKRKISDDDTRGRCRSRTRSSSPTSSARSASSDVEGRRLAPRDWSEVLGIAAFSGWDPAAVQRARRRCQDLFEESMEFVTIDNAHDKSEVDGEGAEGTAASTGENLLCPEPDCSSHPLTFPVTRIYRLREHVKRVHQYSEAQVQKLEKSLGLTRGRSLAQLKNPKEWTPPDPLVCPHAECAAKSKVYPEPRRLLEHLRRKHKYDPRTASPPAGRPAIIGDSQDTL